MLTTMHETMEAEMIAPALGGTVTTPPTLTRPLPQTPAPHQELTPLEHVTGPQLAMLRPQLPAVLTAKDVMQPEPEADKDFVDLKAVEIAIQDMASNASEGTKRGERLDGEASSEGWWDSSASSYDSPMETSESGGDSRSLPGRREAARLARKKEEADLEALKAKVAQVMAEHEKLRQTCSEEDAILATLRWRMQQARAIYSASEVRNERLREELSQLKVLARN